MQALPLEVEDEEPMNKELEVIKIEIDSDPETICVRDSLLFLYRNMACQ